MVLAVTQTAARGLRVGAVGFLQMPRATSVDRCARFVLYGGAAPPLWQGRPHGAGSRVVMQPRR